jgi:hypothetical protein
LQHQIKSTTKYNTMKFQERQKIKLKFKRGDVKLLAETIGCSRTTIERWFRCEDVKLDVEPYITKLHELRVKDEAERLEAIKIK